MDFKYKGINEMALKGYVEQMNTLNLSEKTKSAYNNDVKNLKEYLTETEKNIFTLSEKSELEEYIIWLKETKRESNRSIKRRLCTLKAVLRYTVDEKKVSSDKAIISQDVVSFASNKDIQKLYSYCSEFEKYEPYPSIRAKTIGLMSILFGLKPSELHSMTIDSIHENEIVIQSTSLLVKLINRSFPKEMLEIYLKSREKYLNGYDNCDAFFLSKIRTRLSSNAINYDFRLITKACDLSDLSSSQFRNSCIRHYYENLPDDVLIGKLFDISQSWIKKLNKSFTNQNI